ncbi:MAG: enoyl-CoA hydratase/isomerase family protein [Candidatus Hydrogenedentota bacterium]
MTDLIQTETSEAVASIRMNRPDKRNALNIPMLEALCQAVDAAVADPAVRVIVLRGNGKVFCAGLDLAETTDPEQSHHSAQLVVRMLEALYYAPKLTIAAVHGAAVAGGAGLMSACDLAVATADTVFGYPEVRRGLVAGLVMTFIRRQLQERHARELLLLGEIIEADRAQEIGLINRMVPTDMLDEQVALLVDLARKAGPDAIKETKAWLDQVWHHPVCDDLAGALDLHVRVRNGEEAAEGMRAFLEKRGPKW